MRVVAADQGKQSPVASAEVEESLDMFRKSLQQRPLGGEPMRDLSREILGDSVRV
jgi:hypothetical protein